MKIERFSTHAEEEECRRLKPGPEWAESFLCGPAGALAAARWVFPEADVKVASCPGRPGNIEINFPVPSILLVAWQETKHFRQMIERANTVHIRPEGDQLRVKLVFHDVWLLPSSDQAQNGKSEPHQPGSFFSSHMAGHLPDFSV